MKTSFSNEKDVRAGSPSPDSPNTERVDVAKPAYVRPQILTHSTDKTGESAHPVNACTSFVP